MLLVVQKQAELPFVLPAPRRHFVPLNALLHSGILKALLGTSRASAAADRPNALPEENENSFSLQQCNPRAFFLPYISV